MVATVMVSNDLELRVEDKDNYKILKFSGVFGGQEEVIRDIILSSDKKNFVFDITDVRGSMSRIVKSLIGVRSIIEGFGGKVVFIRLDLMNDLLLELDSSFPIVSSYFDISRLIYC